MDFLCRPPEVHVQLNKTHVNATTISTIDMFVVVGKVTKHCNTSSLMVLSWESSEASETNGAFSVSQTLDVGSENLTITPKTLSPGLYYVRLFAEMNKEEGAINYDYGFLKVVLPDLVAKIRGVRKAVKGTGTIVLDATDSYDPNEPTLKDQGIVFTWLCRREDEDFSNMESLPIDHSYGREKILGGCFGYGVGELNHTGPTLKININKMISQNTYVFMVIVHKENRSSTAYHTLRIESSIPFSIR